jgi:hypothetical protein
MHQNARYRKKSFHKAICSANPHSLSTDLAANVERNPGTLLLPMDLGERVTLTRAPCPSECAVGLVAEVLGLFSEPSTAEKPSRGGKMADHHLVHPGPCPFRTTRLGLSAA